MFKHMRLGIGTKIGLLITGTVVLLSILISVVVANQTTVGMKEIYAERIKENSEIGYNWLNAQFPGDWSIKDGSLYKGTVNMGENQTFVDDVGKITGGTVTLFAGDKRIATNLMNNGKRELGTQADSAVAQKVLKAKESYVGEANVMGTTELTLYKPILSASGETIGMWFVGTPIAQISEHVTGVLLIIVAVLGAGGLAAVLLGLIIVRRMVKPLLVMKRQLKEIADGEGDLTKELEVRSRDEVGELAESFNRMLGNLRSLIRRVACTAEQVSASSEELSASAEYTNQATEQITNTMQELAVGSELQVESVHESFAAIERISAEIGMIAGRSEEAAASANQVTVRASEGNELMDTAMEHMKGIEGTVRHLAGSVKGLGELSENIGRIVEVITGIAAQTNLLALNAAIEAARAGEEGRGFSVVAGEVRKLAEQSIQSAKEITELIASTQAEASDVVLSMEEVTGRVSKGRVAVGYANDAFTEIRQSVKEVSGQVQNIAQAVHHASAGAEAVTQAVHDIQDKVDQAASGTQTVSAAAEEQLASVEQISSAVSSLTTMAEELHQLIGKFKV